MLEIEKAGVEKQSDLLNKVKLMEAKQSLVVRCRLQEEPNKVYCRVTFRSHRWVEDRARKDTLVCQPPYLVTRGWEEVVPWGD